MFFPLLSSCHLTRGEGSGHFFFFHFGHHIPNLQQLPSLTHLGPHPDPLTPHPSPCFCVADQSRQSVRFVVLHGDCVYSQVYSQVLCGARVCKRVSPTLKKALKPGLKTYPPTHGYTHTSWPLRLVRGTMPLFGSVMQRLTLSASVGILLLLVLEVVSPTSPPPPSPPILNLCFMKPDQAICKKRKKKKNFVQ